MTASRFPHPLTLLVACILLAAALSWVLPAGEYQRREDPATGRSMLEDTVVFVGNNMGSVLNHKGSRMPCLMFGGSSVLRTGTLVDFRSQHSWSYVGGFERIERLGIAYNHLLVTMCQLFGLQPEDYEHGQEGIGE